VAGDAVVIQLPPPVAAEPLAEAIPLMVVFEDEHLLVLDKPAGLVVHPASGHDTGTLVNALLARADESPKPPENPMSADRVRWEHIQRIYELCNHNVSETARRLNMHRRTLQRILSKRAPR
jgi:23S rRNA-/tRNA-specific pseudouridylate synthase